MSRPAWILAVTLLGTAATPARELTLSGKVVLSDAGTVPPGCLLRVTLHDLSPGIAKDASVARSSFTAEGKTPIRFELPYNEEAIEPKRLYGLAAVITNSRGAPLWETRVPIRVLTLGNQKNPELLLRPAAQPKKPPDPDTFTVDCGDLTFHVAIQGGSATVTGLEPKLVLKRVESPGGRKFSDVVSMLTVFGEAVYFQGPTRAYRDCKVRSDSH